MRTTVAFILAVILVTSAHAQRSISRVSPDEDSSKLASKWALVIGNADYKDSPLRNPANDASDMATALGNLGFSVDRLVNGTQQQIEDAIRRLGKQVKKGDIALFYFSGHGLQVKGVNYLVPIGMNAQSEDEIKYKAVPAEMVLDKFETARSNLNIVILDACRNNPFKRYRSLNGGLAQMNAPAGTLIAYATAPGSVASDGTDRNSPYTKHLLKAMQEPGIEIGMAFRQVRIGVLKETNYQQVPWESSSLTGEFYFAAEGDAGFYNNRGIEWYEKREYDIAMADFNQAIQLDPKNAIAYFNRGSVWTKKGDDDKALVDYEEAIRLDPDYSDAYNNRGSAWQGKGNLDKATADYEKAIELDPNNGIAYSNRGLLWANRGDYEKAMADCERAVQLDPSNSVTRNNRGLVWARKGDCRKALADYEEAIQLDPNNGKAYNNRGQLWYERGDHDKAMADYDQAIRLDPEFASVYHNRACVWNVWGEYDKVKVDYDIAKRMAPNDACVLAHLAFFLATCPESRYRDGDTAIKHATIACELSGWKVPSYLAALAAAHAEAGKFNEAVKWQTKALNSAPEQYRVGFQYWLDLFKAGKPLRMYPRSKK